MLKNGLRFLCYFSVMIFALVGCTVPANQVRWGVPDRDSMPPANPRGLFNPRNVIEIEGEITKWVIDQKSLDRFETVYMVLNTPEDERIHVRLGPLWYMDQQTRRIQVGDSVRVRGSKVKHNDKLFVIAAQISEGENILKLRDPDGIPYWTPWRIKNLRSE